jgi:hypothetical protein
MSAEVINESDGVLTVRFTGKLKLAELQAAQQKAAEIIERTGKVRIFCIAEDFLGWEKCGGDWGDLSFQAKCDPFIEKIAIVSDKKWEDMALLFLAKGIRKVPIEYFSPAETSRARAWLTAPLESLP